MTITETARIFPMFAGVAYEDKYLPLLEFAGALVLDMLRPGADTNDMRLDFLCAAIANYHYQQGCVSGEAADYTYGGKKSVPSNSSVMNFSERLLRNYYQLCSDLIKPQTFVFMGFSKEEDTV